MNRHYKYLKLAALPLMLLQFEALSQDAGRTFSTLVEYHLKTIRNRDVEGLLSTVHDSVTLIFPDGNKLVSKKKFEAFHREWFADENWKMNTTILNTVEAPTISYAFVRYAYQDNESGPHRENYLLLIFKKVQGHWLLLHDQNTRLPN
jgi:ketosteroid isomerase-like protein